MTPRSALFAPPVQAGHAVSPDGRRICWLAPVDGILNVWAAETADVADGVPLTRYTDRPVGMARWAADSGHVLFARDVSGRETWHVMSVSLVDARVLDLSPGPEDRSFLAATSPLRPEAALLGVVSPGSPFPAWIETDVSTGAAHTVMEAAAFSSVLFDALFRPVAATRPAPDGGADTFVGRDAAGGWRPFRSLCALDARSSCFVAATADGTQVHGLSNVGRDTLALIRIDVASHREEVMFETPGADVLSFLPDASGRPLACTVCADPPRTVALGEGMVADVLALDHALGNWIALSRSSDQGVWTVAALSPDAPDRAWLYERATGRLSPFPSAWPELDGRSWPRTLTETFHARDGLEMTARLTIPPDGGRNGARCSLVVLVHGGPWERDRGGFDPMHQWLVDRGHAVLSPNFRGSSGSGKAFMAAGNLEWGAAMDDDLADATAMAFARHPALDPARVAVMGASYGGYAAMMALARRSKELACGVSICGPSDLSALLANLPPWWASELAMLSRAIGDPSTARGRALLRERSPLVHARSIRRPLLLLHGDLDPRVRREESDRMVEAMGDATEVTYATFPDEAHWISRPGNVEAMHATIEAFLARHLGGWAEPPQESMQAVSSMHVGRDDAGLFDAARPMAETEA